MHRLSLMVPVLILAAAAPADAQLVPGVPVSVEVRPSVSLPVGGFTDTSPGLGAETGFAIALGARIRVHPRIAFYGDYQHGRFGCGECGAVGFEDALPEGGFEVGVRGTLPVSVGGLDPWASAGALVARELQISAGDGDMASDPAMGWAAGAGLHVPLGGGLRLSPGVHYRAYSAEFTFTDLGFELLGAPGTFSRQVEVAAVSLEVGLSYGF